MSKAEDKYIECFLFDIKLRRCDSRDAFIKGYHQAEKDLALTWWDISDIIEIHEDVLEMESCENIYIEVLNRFNKQKGK